MEAPDGETARQTVDDRDSEDRRLLQAGEHATLLAAYYPVVRQRVRLRVAGTDADDVVQRVMLRLCSELSRGRRYGVPYRVVVHQVIGWTIGEHRGGGSGGTLPLDDNDVPLDDHHLGAIESRLDLERILADLPPRQREVLTDRYLHGLEIAEIADRRGMKRNAVDQALFAGRQTLRSKLRPV